MAYELCAILRRFADEIHDVAYQVPIVCENPLLDISDRMLDEARAAEAAMSSHAAMGEVGAAL